MRLTMKPFDLMAALKGDKVVTKSGTLAEIECYYPHQKILHVNINKKVTLIYDYKGMCLTSIDEDNDLFMAPKKKKLWIRVKKMPFIDNNIAHDTSHAYEDRQVLGQDNINYNFIEIEVEE